MLFLVVTISCAEEEKFQRDIPRVITSKKILTSSSGAIFEAEVLTTGSGNIIDHGFQWRESGKSQTDFISLGSLESRSFYVEVNQGFEESKRYEVRAYIKNSLYKSYGGWIEFSGAGNADPIIINISPTQGSWGDTLAVTGRLFSNNASIVQIEFGEVDGEIISVTDSLIKVRVPIDFIQAASTSIKLKVASKFSNSAQMFALKPTQLMNVSPSSGGSGTLIIIRGKYFNTLHSVVRFGDLIVQASQIFKDSIKLILPKEVPPRQYDVTITSGPFQALLNNSFKRNSPKLLEIIPNIGFFGDTVILRGENFGSKFTDNQVSTSTDFAFANIIDVKENELKVIIPPAPFNKIKFRIFADYVNEVSYLSFAIKNPEINAILPDKPIYPGQPITINGKYFYPSVSNYPYTYNVTVDNKLATVTLASKSSLQAQLPLLSVNSSPVSVNHFDTIHAISNQSIVTPITLSSTMPGEQRAKSACFTIGQKSYILTGGALGAVVGNEVYEFDAGNKSWGTVRSFPGVARYGATAFSINNKGYLLGGYTNSGNPLNDLWEYDPLNDTWSRKSDYLFHPLEAFNLAGEIYCISNITYIIIPPSTEVTGFASNTEFWKYDPDTDLWIKKAVPPVKLVRNNYYDYFTMQVGGVLTTAYRSGNNDNYFYSRYDKQNDQWLNMGFLFITRPAPITFEYNNKGYLLTNKLHEYNVTLNKWTLLEENLDADFWYGGDPIKFRVGDSWYFGLYNYNTFPSQNTYRNAFLEFNCKLAGF